ALASDFAIATFARQPQVLLDLLEDDSTPSDLPDPDHAAPVEWGPLLRRYRAARSARLVWRDVLGIDQVADTLAASTALADTCLRMALQVLEADFATRHGHVRHADGSPQRLVVFALGKLGGGEPNSSSDVDLVLAYEHDGERDGPRPLAAEQYY